MALSDMQNMAPKLAKNPLGIIALFIVLIYGFASLLLGLSGENLTESQRWPIIWFLVVFPNIVLFCFVYLVSRHHTKLYSPSDFENENTFIDLLNPEAANLLNNYAEDINNQLNEAREKLGNLEKNDEKKSKDILNARNAYVSLQKDYEMLKASIAEHKRPSINTLVNSAASSQELAESTNTSTSVTKNYLAYIADMVASDEVVKKSNRLMEIYNKAMQQQAKNASYKSN